jgi:putative membrane protein
MVRLRTTVSIIAVLLAAPALAQNGNPGFMVLGAGPDQPNPSDRVFVHAATMGGMAEVEFGRLAEQRGQSEAVKDFARRMVEDHSKANDRLTGLAEEDGIAVPAELHPRQKAKRDLLAAARGELFDLIYVQGQVADHQKAVQLLEYEIGSGQDTDLKSFAEETLPIVLQHLQMAKAIQAELAGAAP